LALDKARYISPKTQKQALSALVFLYSKVLNTELVIEDWVKPRQSHHLSVVLSTTEVKGILSNLQDPYLTIAQLMYGAGLRLIEAMRLRVKDRITMLPKKRAPLFHSHNRKMPIFS
jgi:site-specific recombinase XerD